MTDTRATDLGAADPTATDHTGPEVFGDLPIQPTGSGVADLEIAYEQMRLSEGAGMDAGAFDATAPNDIDSAPVPIETGDAATESAAHPS